MLPLRILYIKGSEEQMICIHFSYKMSENEADRCLAPVVSDTPRPTYILLTPDISLHPKCSSFLW